MMTISHGYGAIASPTPGPFVRPAPAFSAGIMTADGAGHFTGGWVDTNVGGTVGQALPVSGSYSVASNGRGMSTIVAGSRTNTAAFYLLSANRALTVGLDTWGTGISLFGPQGGTKPYSAASVKGHYAFTLRGTLTSRSTDVAGQIELNGTGGLSGHVDVNAAGVLSQNLAVTGSYTMSSTGRGTATITIPTASWTVTMYLQDPSTILLLGTSYPASGGMDRQY